MHPADINAALRKAGSSQAQIARWFGQTGQKPVSAGAVSIIVNGRMKSARIARRISEVTGIPVARLWPGKYPALAAEQIAERAAAGAAHKGRGAQGAATGPRR